MNTVGIRSLRLVVVLATAVACAWPIALSAQDYNLFKEVSDKKNTITWSNAPSNALPRDVCNILEACGGQSKIIVLPVATERGQRVGRGLYLSPARDSAQGDFVILQRQTPSDIYFFRLSKDGNLEKTAYIDLANPLKNWLAMGVSLARNRFDPEKQTWHDHVMKLGAPAQ